MKVIYLAGKNLDRANRVAKILEDSGYSIPCNWYYNYKDDETNFSPEDEVQAVRSADVLVYLWESDQESARYDVGMAIALGKPVVVVHDTPKWFLQLSNIHAVSRDEDIIKALSEVG